MTSKKFFQAPIKAYQYISRMLPASCRYYPTCSEYAKWQFEFNAPYKAALSSGLRILRCNQLFEGGIDYPVVKLRTKEESLLCKTNPLYGKIKIKYWLIPKKGSGVAMLNRRLNIHTPDSKHQQGSGVAMLSRRVNIHTPDSKHQQGSGVAMLSRRVNIHTPDSPQYYIIKDICDTYLELSS